MRRPPPAPASAHSCFAAASRPAAPLSTPLSGLPRLLILCFVGALVIVPLLATAIGGFKELGELRTNPVRPADRLAVAELLGHPFERPLLAHSRQLALHLGA